MRLFLLLCAVLAATAALFAQMPSLKPLSPFEQALIANQKQFLQAYADKSAAQVSQAIAEDFKGIGTNGDFYDREEAVSSAQEGLPKDMLSYDFHVVQLDNDCAVVSYNMVVPGGHPRYRHMADTWTKIDGQWKLKFQQITPNLWSAKDFD